MNGNEVKILFILIILPLCWSWTAIMRGSQNLEFPDKCIDPKTNKFYNNLDRWSNYGECHENICHIVPPNKFYLNINGCIKIIPPEGCQVTEEDLSKKFPECCPKMKC